MASATWTAPRDWADAYVVPASDLQAYLSNNDLWLWSALTGAVVQDHVLAYTAALKGKDVGGTTRDLHHIDGAGNIIFGWVGSGGAAYVFRDNTNTQTLLSVGNGGNITVLGSRVILTNFGGVTAFGHRHYRGDDRHLESGSVTIAGSATATITYTRSFAGQPSVVWSEEGSQNGGTVSHTVVSGQYTGFVFTTFAGSTGTFRWIAEGPST